MSNLTASVTGDDLRLPTLALERGSGHFCCFRGTFLPPQILFPTRSACSKDAFVGHVIDCMHTTSNTTPSRGIKLDLVQWDVTEMADLRVVLDRKPCRHKICLVVIKGE